jgi:hypothetical protein
MWSGKVEAILELEKYEPLRVDKLFSKLKSSEVDRGVHAKMDNSTDPHSLALVFGSRTNANMSSRQFSLSCLVSMPDEEFDVLGEEDLALLSRRFERMYTNQKNARRSSGMCYRCGKHSHFIAECPEAMEVKPEHKHHSRTDHKHRSRDEYKGKNKSERRPRKSGGHKKKDRAMVAGASDIDSSSCYSSLSSSDEEENRHKGKVRARTSTVGGLLSLSFLILQVGGLEGFWLIDTGCSRHMTGDRRWFSSLTLLMTKECITFGDNGKGRVLSVSTVKVTEFVTLRRVSLVKSLGYNLLSVSKLLDEGFEVRFKMGLFSCFGFSRRYCVYNRP